MFTDNAVENFVIWAMILYFIPTLIALLGRHHNRAGVFIANLFFGWTLIGWILVLIWSCERRRRPIVVAYTTPGVYSRPMPAIEEWRTIAQSPKPTLRQRLEDAGDRLLERRRGR